MERGHKNDISPFSNFISTISQKKEDSVNENSPEQLVITDIKNGERIKYLII